MVSSGSTYAVEVSLNGSANRTAQRPHHVLNDLASPVPPDWQSAPTSKPMIRENKVRQRDSS